MDEFFYKQVPLLFKSPEREDRKSFVRLHMGMQHDKHNSRKELVVKLTDDQDLFFLYTLHLAEEDFQSLKNQQGLLVDFAAFPQKMIDLLEMCIREEHKDNPKFVLHFVSGGSTFLGGESPCTLNIIETNPFKHLNHLSLKFLPGSDSDVKTHLADGLTKLKESNSLIQQKFEHTSRELTSKLQHTEEVLSTKTSELESLKLEWSSRLADVSSKHKEEVTLEKEKTVQFQSSMQIRFERDRRELEQAQTKSVKQLETRLSELEINNKDLTDGRYKSEATIRDYKSRLSVLEEEHARVKSELGTLRKDNAALDTLRHDHDKNSNQLQTRVAVLEQEIKDKLQLLAKSNDLLESEQDKRGRVESELDKRQKEISKLESKTQAMGEELKKGNGIIKKLQNEIKTYHAKVKLRTQIATEQEKLLGEKDQELEKLRQDLASTKDNLRDSQEKNEKLSSNLEKATEKLEESKKILKTNESMIQWLNKQINEQRVNQNQLGTFELPASQSRVPLSAIHNFSASSHSSVLAHEADGRQQFLQQRMGVGVAPQAGRHQQVQYQPTNNFVTPLSSNNNNNNNVNHIHHQHHNNNHLDQACKSAIPVPHSSTPATAHPNSSSSPQGERLNNSGGSLSNNSARNNPQVDPKFLTKRDEAIPLRSLHNSHQQQHNNSGFSSLSNPVTLVGSLSKAQQQPSAPSHPVPSSTHPPVSITSSLLPSSSTSVPAHSSTLLSTQNTHSYNSSNNPLMNGVRLNQHMIVPKPQPPLASAYFPGNTS